MRKRKLFQDMSKLDAFCHKLAHKGVSFTLSNDENGTLITWN